MAEMWKAGQDVYDLMNSVMQRHHIERLFLIENQIDIIFKEKASVKGGRVIQGVTKRTPSLLSVLSENEAVFVIELAADEWQAMDPEGREALLDHHLCSMVVVENPKSGNVTYKIAPPDFIGYKGEIQRHGVWRYLNHDDKEDGETVIEQLFGAKDE